VGIAGAWPSSELDCNTDVQAFSLCLAKRLPS
jgi:hypothetical protein